MPEFIRRKRTKTKRKMLAEKPVGKFAKIAILSPNKKDQCAMGKLNVHNDFAAVNAQNDNYNVEYLKSLNYCHYNVDTKTLIRAVLIWCKEHKDKKYKIISKLPDYHFESLGKTCYMINRGAELSTNCIQRLHEEVDKLYALANIHCKPAEEMPDEVLEVGTDLTQEYIKNKAVDTYTLIEKIIDGFCQNQNVKLDKVDIDKLFKDRDIRPIHTKHIKEFLLEDMAGINADGEQEKEAYSYMSAKSFASLQEFYTRIDQACQKIEAISKTPIIKKTTDVYKMIKRAKCVDKFNDVSGQRPTCIIGANKVWVYNTKTKKIGKYVSTEPSGMSISGINIVGFDTTLSVEKMTRSSENIDIKQFKWMVDVEKDRVFEGLSGIQTKLSGKTHDYLLIIGATP